MYDNITIRKCKQDAAGARASDRVSNSAAIPLPTACCGDRFRCQRLDQIRLMPLTDNEFW